MMKRFLIISLAVSVLFLTFLHLQAEAQETSQKEAASESSQFVDHGAGYLPYTEPSPFGSGGMLGAIARTAFALAIVLGLLYALLWGLKRFSSSSVVAPSSESIRIVGRLYLNPKTAIYFVRVADELLLLGTSSSNVSLLTNIKDPQRIEQIEGALRGASPYASGKFFSRFFDRSMMKFQKELGDENSAFDDQIRALDGQLDRLKNIVRRRRADEKE